jgi:transposase
MAWREVDTVDLRMEFVTEADRGLATITELAAIYGISRKTAYKWLARYAQEGPTGLVDRSRRPHGHPLTTSREMSEALCAAHRRFPLWSPAKLRDWLARQPEGDACPSRTTAMSAAARRPVPGPRPPSGRAPRRDRRPPAAAANELWMTDFRTFSDRRSPPSYPLTLRDGFSRFVLRCTAWPESIATTRPCFERAFREYGLPERLRMDNGRPFASPGSA